MSVIIATSAPSPEIEAEFLRSTLRVVRRVDVYERDCVTPYKLDAGIQSGTVSADMTRSERRNFQCVIDDQDMSYGPGGFWYDKVIKPYRGIVLNNGDTWLTPLGVFFPDSISRPRFPSNTYSVACRDMAKVVQQSLFSDTNNEPITLPEGQLVTEAIRSIAANAGVPEMNITYPPEGESGYTIPADTTFVQGDDRWAAIQTLAAGINYEAFFDAYGILVVRPETYPDTGAISYTFETGAVGNLVDFNRSTNDSWLKNDVIVKGSSDGNSGVWARAENTDSSSPTAIQNVGRRTKIEENGIVANNDRAQERANTLLSRVGLEQYDLSLTSLIIPWLEPGSIVEAFLPDSEPYDPTRYLLSNVSIPLAIDAMTAQVKRLINVG